MDRLLVGVGMFLRFNVWPLVFDNSARRRTTAALRLWPAPRKFVTSSRPLPTIWTVKVILQE